MISDYRQLKQTREALNRLEEDLISLNHEVYPVNPERFHLMAEAYVDHIIQLRSQIDEYIGIKTYQDKLQGVWLRLIGPSIQLGSASASLLTSTIENFRKSIRSITAILKGEMPYRKGGLSKDVETSCDLVIIGLTTGSLRIGLGLPPERQISLFDTYEEPVVKAIDTFMEVVSWASSPEISSALPASISDLPSRDYILRQVMNMAPTKKLPVDIIEFSGTLVHLPKAPLLTRAARSRLCDVIAKETGAEYMEAVGTIREIDLDYKKFYLRERPDNEPNLRCEVNEDMIEDAKAALGERVIVAGTVKRDESGRVNLLKVKTMEISADEGDAGA
ncbi:MAG: hypothetical protein HZC52_12305 [Planctomycetes bacterium]|nr:hypothetical protein [Planctomycetota bacterium]